MASGLLSATMMCRLCGKEIGSFRRWLDDEYCSENHRRRATVHSSARRCRDLAAEGEFEGSLPITLGDRKESRSNGHGLAIVLLMVGAMALTQLRPGEQRPSPPAGYLPSAGTLSEEISRVLPIRGAAALREDFRADLRDWQGQTDSPDDWGRQPGLVRPGQLRLWKPTMAMADYDLVFQTSIERQAVSWVFRATDLENYYAEKICVVGTGRLARAQIVRYAVIKGTPQNRVHLPLPMPVVENVAYEVSVRAQGSEYRTWLNGQLIDSWSDRRFCSGGVGFFSDKGERSAIRWVKVKERRPFLERFVPCYFLLPVPGALLSR